jgi:hypothetical protein
LWRWSGTFSLVQGAGVKGKKRVPKRMHKNGVLIWASALALILDWLSVSGERIIV